jgi:hypothetical protein
MEGMAKQNHGFESITTAFFHRGECFVLGIMDGEVMDTLDKGVVALEEIEVH